MNTFKKRLKVCSIIPIFEQLQHLATLYDSRLVILPLSTAVQNGYEHSDVVEQHFI